MIREGCILSFFLDGKEYDGVVWRVMHEDETNLSLVLRYVDIISE